jgi:co-chaperonin GroES (HSP10)
MTSTMTSTQEKRLTKPNAAPSGKTSPLTFATAASTKRPNEDDSLTQVVTLPDPVGHHMLVALPTIKERTASGLIIPDAVTEKEKAAAVFGTVLAMGDACYQDKARFPTGPWCKVGDTIMFSRYQGMRFKSQDAESGGMIEYRMMADDCIVATVPVGAKIGGL